MNYTTNNNNVPSSNSTSSIEKSSKKTKDSETSTTNSSVTSIPSIHNITSPKRDNGKSIFNFFHKIQRLFPFHQSNDIIESVSEVTLRPLTTNTTTTTNETTTQLAGQISIVNEITKQCLDDFSKRYDNKFMSNSNIDLNKDFTLYRTVGTGSYGRVILSLFKNTKKFYAVKLLEKKLLIEKTQIDHLINEKRILGACDHPNIMKCYFCFKDTTNLYFVFDFYSNGDLYNILKVKDHFNEDESKFYAANIYLGFEYLHLNKVVYRDLKPENIIVSDNGYLKLADFGFSKRIDRVAHTYCGTPEYIAPEMLERMPYSFSVDWWSYGVFVYELNFGTTPFKSSNSNFSLNELIIEANYNIPNHCTIELKSFLSNLLEKNIKKRLGCIKTIDVAKHKWFNGLNWEGIYTQQIKAPIIPKIKTPIEILLTNEYKNQTEKNIQLYKNMKYEEEFNDF